MRSSFVRDRNHGLGLARALNARRYAGPEIAVRRAMGRVGCSVMETSPRARLLAWYDASARDLPWRRTRDPYAIWVSEVMLQQTRVETVVRYYARFLERFPTPRALAAAPEDQVMAAWSGLGYYRRARLLHQGVREVIARYGGKVPEAPEARRALPGIGRYTAGAIGSIAFERNEPIVDGNVARVLSRVHGIEGELGAAATQKQLWHAAERWVQGERPGAFNQALMELGATLCNKLTPRCEPCPLSRGCVAYATHATARLPQVRKKAKPREVACVAVLASRCVGSSLELWLERGAGSLFGGLWNLPMREGRGRTAAERLVRASGLHAELAKHDAGELEHVLSHRALRVQLWRAEVRDPRGCAGLRAVALAELAELGVSSLTRKALTAFGFGAQAALPF